MIVIESVTEAMIRAARRAVSGFPCTRFNKRGLAGADQITRSGACHVRTAVAAPIGQCSVIGSAMPFSGCGFAPLDPAVSIKDSGGLRHRVIVHSGIKHLGPVWRLVRGPVDWVDD